MPKISDEELQAIQLRLFKKDLEYLRKFYSGTVGVNKAIRNIVRSFVRHAEAQANSAIDKLERKGKEQENDYDIGDHFSLRDIEL